MNSLEKIHNSWNPIINLLYQEPLKTLNEKVLPNISYQPKTNDIFNVFSMPVDNIKVFLLGQDPFPNPGDAIGYSFINGTDKIPASLRIIYKELENERFQNPNINGWIKQGVFLLNTALTVETGNPGSHLQYWSDFTKRIINFVSFKNPCIWLMWGKKAQDFIPQISKNSIEVNNYNDEAFKNIPISNNYNYILRSAHPAAETYSGGKAGFFGNNHFIRTNELLDKLKRNKITW